MLPMLIFLVFHSSVTGEGKHAVAVGDAEFDYESDNTDCDSVATFSSGEIFRCFLFAVFRRELQDS
jgi:hypothetical protein